MKMQRPAEALPYFDRLVKEFEQSEYLEERQEAVRDPQGGPGQESQEREHVA